MSSTVEDFIEHHGIKGMQWGVRKRSSDRRPSGDYKKAAPLRKKNVSELTNKQLKVVNERANLESNFKRLNPSTAAKGKNVVNEIMAVAGTAATAYAMFHSPMGKAIREAGKKKVQQLIG